jgi:hypothetical protein
MMNVPMVHAPRSSLLTAAASKRWSVGGTSSVRWGAWAMPGAYEALFLASDEAKCVIVTELVVDGGLMVNCV